MNQTSVSRPLITQLARDNGNRVLEWLKELRKSYPNGAVLQKSAIRMKFDLPHNQSILLWNYLAEFGYKNEGQHIIIPLSDEAKAQIQQQKQQELKEQQRMEQEKQKRLEWEQKERERELKERQEQERLQKIKLNKLREQYQPELEQLELKLQKEKQDTYFVCGNNADCNNCDSFEIYNRCPHKELVNRISKLQSKLQLNGGE